MAVPRLRLPHRNYLVLGGLLASVPTLGDRVEHALSPQSPNLLWPADRSWCLATEIDFDSTLIGGPQSLVETLLAAEGVEAWAVGPDDSLAVDGDTVNR